MADGPLGGDLPVCGATWRRLMQEYMTSKRHLIGFRSGDRQWHQWGWFWLLGIKRTRAYDQLFCSSQHPQCLHGSLTSIACNQCPPSFIFKGNWINNLHMTEAIWSTTASLSRGEAPTLWKTPETWATLTHPGFREFCGLQIPVHATSDKDSQISQIVLEYCRGHQRWTYIFIRKVHCCGDIYYQCWQSLSLPQLLNNNSNEKSA